LQTQAFALTLSGECRYTKRAASGPGGGTRLAPGAAYPVSGILGHMVMPQGWSEIDGSLQREFRFSSFAEALAFVNRVGELPEAENHHPDVELGWGRVVLRWRTHSADAITDRDRELAEKSGRLAA